MRTAPAVVGDPFAKDSSEAAFVERDQPVETHPADRPDQALAKRVGSRRSHRRLQDSHLHRRPGSANPLTAWGVQPPREQPGFFQEGELIRAGITA